jgi:hypothetical protein
MNRSTSVNIEMQEAGITPIGVDFKNPEREDGLGNQDD